MPLNPDAFSPIALNCRVKPFTENYQVFSRYLLHGKGGAVMRRTVIVAVTVPGVSLRSRIAGLYVSEILLQLFWHLISEARVYMQTSRKVPV